MAHNSYCCGFTDGKPPGFKEVQKLVGGPLACPCQACFCILENIKYLPVLKVIKSVWPFRDGVAGIKDKTWGHVAKMVTLSPSTSEIGICILAQPQVGKLVVGCRWSAVYSTETLTYCVSWFPLPIKLPVVI